MPKHSKKLIRITIADRQVCHMPAGLRHQLPGQPFAWMKSEVVQWLLAQPVVAKQVFQKFYDRGCIFFDPRTGTWTGIGDATPVPRITAKKAEAGADDDEEDDDDF